MLQKRYQYWTFENGKPIVKWTEWFKVPDNITREEIQMKGYKGHNLLNEYRTMN